MMDPIPTGMGMGVGNLYVFMSARVLAMVFANVLCLVSLLVATVANRDSLHRMQRWRWDKEAIMQETAGELVNTPTKHI
jgi:membrane protein YdbS with pleckstrin-like domain